MKLFLCDELREAIEFSASGEQALHVFNARPPADAPKCFRMGCWFAHLFDQDLKALKATARRLGIRKVFVHHEGEKSQHVDLCGKPLAEAVFSADWGEHAQLLNEEIKRTTADRKARRGT